MKKVITFFITSLLFLIPAIASEWGGLVTTDITANSVDPEKTDNIFFRQTDGISLWAKDHIMNNPNWYLAAQGSYKFNYSFNGLNKNGKTGHLVNLDLLKLDGNVTIDDFNFSMALGRFIVMDNTAKIFSQNSDGISLKFEKPFASLGLYAGYTGLLNGRTVAILDKDGFIDINFDDIYSKTHQYVPLLISADFPSVFLSQSLGLQASGFIDLEKEKYNRYYGSFYMKGPIANSFYYNFITCFGTETFKEVNNYSELSFMMLLKSFGLGIDCEYASGEQWIFKPFKGFNVSNAYNAFWCPQYSGVLLPGLEISCSDKNVNFELKGKLVMLFPDNDIIIQGISADTNITLNIFADFAYNLGFQIYHDLESKGDLNYYKLNMGFNLSF